MSGTVRQISVVLDPSIPYFLRVDWAEDLGAGFTLALSDGSSSWIGEVPEEEMTGKATQLGVKREKCVEDLHQALTGGGESLRGRVAEKEEYLFHLSSDHGCLSYDKKTQRGVLVNMGAVELHPAPVDLNREMIAHTLEHSADLEAENRRLQEKNQTLRQERQHLLAEVTGVTVKSKAGDSIKEEEDLPQSFHPSQAPTVLIGGCRWAEPGGSSAKWDTPGLGCVSG
uniref:DNA repair protein XRCC4-like isoform X2 n=1 Tax=Oncorhynchus gorbuscha TaxID=8017 RepID=UPI001EAECD5E|nr:DNA repair protein XRCC4-like isoform X2 [Oncorhynchus gorbuscha]